MKTKIIIGVLVLCLIGAIVAAVILSKDDSADASETIRSLQLQTAFTARYGTDNTIQQISKVDDLYLFIWDGKDATDGKTYRHASLSLDGLFIEVVKVEVLQ